MLFYFLYLYPMIRKLIFATAVLFATACNSGKDERPSTALDTGREFIRASLDGNFEKAGSLIHPDEENKQLFETYKEFYAQLPAKDKESYKTASYEINELKELNDSATVINYSNSYMKKPMEIMVSKKNAVWGIDFKYSYSNK